MAIIKVQKGTKDILPSEMSLWHFMEEKANKVFSSYGAKEIRTPIFEATELFARGVGDTTDIVNKEMYTFEKSERSLTLRPENTAGVVRSFIENGMHRLSAPVKLWYKGPMFRYERPQAGRQRQFHQVGVEVFGIKQATADAEVILMAVNYLKELGLNDLSVELNSLGCPQCRETFKTKLKEVIKPYLSELCPDCQARYEKNPLRLLDCKVDECKNIYAKQEIQNIIQSDFICEECAIHFTELKQYFSNKIYKEENGKFIGPKTSPKKLKYPEVFYELYKIKKFLKNDKLKITLLVFDIDEYRIKGKSRSGYICFDRMPTKLIKEIILLRKEDYLTLLPSNLNEEFTSSDVSKLSKCNLRYVNNMLNVMSYLEVVEVVGKIGKKYLYKVKH